MKGFFTPSHENGGRKKKWGRRRPSPEVYAYKIIYYRGEYHYQRFLLYNCGIILLNVFDQQGLDFADKIFVAKKNKKSKFSPQNHHFLLIYAHHHPHIDTIPHNSALYSIHNKDILNLDPLVYHPHQHTPHSTSSKILIFASPLASPQY